MIKVLLITEAYCDGDVNKGESNTLGNVHNTLKNAGFIEYKSIFYDKLFMDGRTSTSQDLEKMIDHAISVEKFNTVIVLPMHGYHNNPSIKALESLKVNKTSIVYIWPDSALPWAQNEINRLGHLVDLHILWDSNEINTHYNDKCLFTWTPQDSHIFHSVHQDIDRPIDVSFIGSMRQPGRAALVNGLQQLGINVYVNGGQRERPVSRDEYAALLKQSKITLNMSHSQFPGKHQFKGRVMEALMCGAMLLESENHLTKMFLAPGEDYIEYNSTQDCADKIKYYLDNPDLRKKIAYQGTQTYLNTYSNSQYWRLIFERLQTIHNSTGNTTTQLGSIVQ